MEPSILDSMALTTKIPKIMDPILAILSVLYWANLLGILEVQVGRFSAILE